MAQRLLSYFDRMNDSILLHVSFYSSDGAKQRTVQAEHGQLSDVSPSTNSLVCFPTSAQTAR